MDLLRKQTNIKTIQFLTGVFACLIVGHHECVFRMHPRGERRKNTGWREDGAQGRNPYPGLLSLEGEEKKNFERGLARGMQF